jgi:hypothetical protein
VALLECLPNGQLTTPGVRLVIGRSDACGLKLDDPRVSGEHAVLTYRRQAWLLRDLGSRNGTSVDGRALGSGEAASVEKGTEICLGGRDVRLRCLDAGPPGAYALGDDGEICGSEHELLALPSSDEPVVTIYRDDDRWLVETPKTTRPAVHGKRLKVGDRQFSLLLPPPAPDLPSTIQSNEPPAATLDALQLAFEASVAEELITIILRGPGGGETTIAPRVCNYLLLVLARARRDEAARHGDGPDAGWLYSDELARMMATNHEYINVLVYRARSLFAAEGVVDASRIVERRPATAQLRIGVPTSHLHLP